MHIILGTPGSRRSTLSQVNSQNEDHPTSYFLLPDNMPLSGLPGSYWKWKDNHIQTNIENTENIEEWFLFLCNEISIADQIESIIAYLDLHQELEIGQIVTFINANLLEKENHEINSWMMGAHFSDAICFSNRNNENAQFIKSILDRFKKMLSIGNILPKQYKIASIERILSPVPRRICHLFDPPDMLEPEDSRIMTYLAKYPNGNRIKLFNFRSGMLTKFTFFSLYQLGSNWEYPCRGGGIGRRVDSGSSIEWMCEFKSRPRNDDFAYCTINSKQDRKSLKINK